MMNWPFITILFSWFFCINAACNGNKWLYIISNIITNIFLIISINNTCFYYLFNNIVYYFIFITLIIMSIVDCYQIFFPKNAFFYLIILIFTCMFYNILFALQISLIFLWQIMSVIIFIMIITAILLYKYKCQLLYIYHIILFFISLTMLYIACMKYFYFSTYNNMLILLAIMSYFVSNNIFLITNFYFKKKNLSFIITALNLLGRSLMIYIFCLQNI